MARVVVVGSGAGGLATAARLATRRHDVTVLEASAELGGRLRPAAGVSIVPEIITLPAPLRDLFNKTGGSIDDVIELQAAPPTVVWLSNDTQVELPSVDPAAVAEALGTVLGSHTAAQFRELMADAALLWQHARRPLLETPGGSGTWFINEVAASAGGRWKAMRLLRPHQSFARATSVLDSADARALLDVEALQAGSLPQDLPAWEITRPYVRYLFGEWVVAGGNAALADVLVERARQRGANFRAEARAVAIRQSGGRVTGVRLKSGEVISCDWVVWAGDSFLHGAESQLVPAQQLNDLSATVLVLSTPATNVHHVAQAASRITVLPRNRETALAEIASRDVLTDPWLLIEKRATSGATTDTHVEWVVRAPINTHAARDPYQATRLVDALVSRGLLAHSEVVHVKALRDSGEIGDHLHSVGGRLVGPASQGPWRSMLRPPITTDVTGLLRAGGGVVAGPGLPYAVQTGEVIAGLIGRPSARAAE